MLLDASASFVTLFGVNSGGIQIPTLIGTQPGFTLWVDPPLATVPGMSDASGNGTYNQGLINASGAIGLEFAVQSFQLDPSLMATYPIPYTATRASKLRIGSF